MPLPLFVTAVVAQLPKAASGRRSWNPATLRVRWSTRCTNLVLYLQYVVRQRQRLTTRGQRSDLAFSKEGACDCVGAVVMVPPDETNGALPHLHPSWSILPNSTGPRDCADGSPALSQEWALVVPVHWPGDTSCIKSLNFCMLGIFVRRTEYLT